MAQVHGFMYTYDDKMDPRGEGPSHVIYDTEAEAVKHAGRSAVAVAKEELESLDWEPLADEPELLREIIEDGARGDWRAAFEGWKDYQALVSHDIFIEVESV